MLRDRLRTSAILITIVIGLLCLDRFAAIDHAAGLWLLPLLMFLTLGTGWEMATMLSRADQPIHRGVTVIGTGMIAISAAIPMLWAFSSHGYPMDCPVGRLGWIVLVCVATVFFVLISEMRVYGRDPKSSLGLSINRTTNAVFVSVYVGLPMAMLTAIRSMHSVTTNGHYGMAALITMIIVTKVADSGAYFSGRALGRHKLIPRLSPGKTIEGAIGGIMASTVAAFVCLTWLFPALGVTVSGGTLETSETTVRTGLSAILADPIWGALLLGPTLAITGMVGDLAESLFKRDSGVKDSGNLLPGLGGVWDVTDSLIAASVPAFFCFAAGVGGP